MLGRKEFVLVPSIQETVSETAQYVLECLVVMPRTLSDKYKKYCRHGRSIRWKCSNATRCVSLINESGCVLKYNLDKSLEAGRYLVQL